MVHEARGRGLERKRRSAAILEQLTEEGHYTGGIVAFGYKRVQKGRLNKKNQAVCDLEIDEEEAAIVRLIFQKYVYEGYGANGSATILSNTILWGAMEKTSLILRLAG